MSLSKNCGHRSSLKISEESGPAGSYLEPEIDLNTYISCENGANYLFPIGLLSFL